MAAPEMKHFQGPAMLDLELQTGVFFINRRAASICKTRTKTRQLLKAVQPLQCLLSDSSQWGVRGRSLNPTILFCT
jgi:hypothetical protein